MISELAGFTLSRTIPDKTMLGILSGAYKVYGGVVRNDSGHIVAHLVNATTPGNLLSAFSSPFIAALSGINTFQLHRIGADVTKLLTLAKGTMLLSGLTLAASAAGFLFLNNKIGKIDKTLQTIAKDVKSIKKFLELHERARLISAIKSIRELDQIEDDSTRLQMLVSSRQTLGEIHEKYKSLLISYTNVNELMPVEEYFTITAIGHSLCSAELCMFDQAAKDMSEAQVVWEKAVKTFIRQHVFKNDPERFLTRGYAKHIKTEEIVDWFEFVENTGKGIDRLDDLRSDAHRINIFNSLSKDESIAIKVTKKLIERYKILQGYVSQYEYYASIKQRPTVIQQYFNNLSKDEQINDCYLFVSNNPVTV